MEGLTVSGDPIVYIMFQFYSAISSIIVTIYAHGIVAFCLELARNKKQGIIVKFPNLKGQRTGFFFVNKNKSFATALF